MSIQSYKTEDARLQRSVYKERLDYWQGRLDKLKQSLDSSMPVSQFTSICSQINTARSRVLKLERALKS